MSYLIETRRKVEAYLRKQKSPVALDRVHRLGTDKYIVRRSSLKLILDDLKREKKVLIVIKNHKGQHFTTISWLPQDL